MYKDIFESIRNEAEKRNLRERTIQLIVVQLSRQKSKLFIMN